MSHRCTPFGLFAGISTGNVSNNTSRIELETTENYKRKTKLDMNYLCSLVQELEKLPQIRNLIDYYPNTSIYRINNQYRYVEYTYKNSIRHHYIMSIDDTNYIRKVLQFSEKGVKINQLQEFLTSDGIQNEDAQKFIHDLIDNQILISAISPTVSGDDYLRYIIEQTNITRLVELENILERLDKKTFHNNLNTYSEVVNKLEEIQIPFDKKFLFQTDLITTTKSNNLNKNLLKEIHEGVTVLNKLTTRVRNPRLEVFKKTFSNRYEEEEVPLSLALDVETGIGYNQNSVGSYDICPLIDDLIIPQFTTKQDKPFYRYELKKADEFIYKKFIEAKKLNSKVITLKEEDLQSFEENWDDLPITFPLLCSIFQNENENIISITDAGGPSASYLLGRFSHTSEDVRQILEEIVAKETNSNENTILAEIVHLPESRTGNILYRCNLRNYEIPYLAKSNLSSSCQIPISDLQISLRNDELILRSEKLNLRVEPRMGNAHSFDYNSLPIYNFLGDMQTQNLCESLEFSWGPALMNEEFFPRVCYKNIILSPAKWLLKKTTIENITNKKNLIKWSKENDIPNTFFLKDYDNELFIDLKNDLSCKMFLSEINKKASIELKENLYSEYSSIVNSSEGTYANEFIFSLYKHSK